MNKIVILLSTLFFLWSCEPQPDELKLFDELVVETNFDQEVNFNAYTTYSIATDTIGLVSNLTSDDTIIVGTGYARPVIEAVKANLSNRGFQQVDVEENPDLAINVFIVKNLNIFQQYSYPNFYGYPGYYYPNYYGYGSFYYNYPYVRTYLYNTGVLVIEMVDLKNVINNQVKVVWNAYLGDVYTSLDPVAQSVNAVHQAFTQSSYLLVN